MVTRVCEDYDSYLKIGPSHKKRGLDCWARQALFALITSTISKTSDFETPPYYKRANFEHCNIASKHKSKHTHTNPKRHNDELHLTSMLLRLHYLQSANRILILFWAPFMKFITIILKEFTHFFSSITRPPKINQLITFTHFINLITQVTAIGLKYTYTFKLLNMKV